jgi:hypothetical protein
MDTDLEMADRNYSCFSAARRGGKPLRLFYRSPWCSLWLTRLRSLRGYGWHANKMRGIRRPGISPAALEALTRSHPARLACGPLRCPACNNPMPVLAVTDDPRIVEKILHHLSTMTSEKANSYQSPRPCPPQYPLAQA